MKQSQVVKIAFAVVATLCVSLKLAVLYHEDVMDDQEYRGYTTRYFISLSDTITKHPCDIDSRLKLAEGLYDCGFYSRSEALYHKAFELSGRHSLTSEENAMRSMHEFAAGGGDHPDDNKVDVSALQSHKIVSLQMVKIPVYTLDSFLQPVVNRL